MKKIISVLLTITVLASCTLKLLPAKDAVITVEATSIVNAAHDLYNRMLASRDFSYVSYESDYQGIATRIDSIYFAVQRRPRAHTLLEPQYRLARGAFYGAWDYHKTKGKLNEQECRIYNAYIDGRWLPILKSEMQLK